MNLKVALLLLLVFASTFTATAVAFNASAPVTFQTLVGVLVITNSPIEPLGDPIEPATVPH